MDQLNFLGQAEQAVSPIRRQYLDVKRRHPDAILLFRLGDFYETFDEDARILSTELDIVLTAREMGKGEKVPLAGIPYHAAEGYIARLITRGYKLAICEQVGSTAVRGLVPREVVRVITPGTLVEDSLLPSKANNFLVSLLPTTTGAGMAVVEISTGEFLATEVQGHQWRDQISSELERLRPAECLLDPSQSEEPAIRGLLPHGCFATAKDILSTPSAERYLRDHFHVATIEGLGLSGIPLASRAAATLLSYLRETQPAALGHLQSLHVYSLDQFMKLDFAARRHLELTANAVNGEVAGSLLGVLDYTRTPMGGRLLHTWVGQPLLDQQAIEARLEVVEEMVRSPLGRVEIAMVLGGVSDLERLGSRAAQGTLSPRDCHAISRSLRAVPVLVRLLEKYLARTASSMPEELDACSQAAAAIESTLAESPAPVGEGAIKQGRSAELDEVRSITGDTKQWIAGLERQERERTGVKSLRIGYNRVFGYYIEVTKPNLEASTDEYARMKTGAARISEMLEALGYQRKQTIANAERFVTRELKEQELRLQNAQAEIEALEKQIYAELLAELSAVAPRLAQTARAVARLDALLSLAEAAVAGRYVRPTIDDSRDLEIRSGRHPIVERMLPAGDYVPNDSSLLGDSQMIAILTGPNMAGKSTYILGTALIAVMAQVGSFVPASEARIGLVDRVFTRVGAQHDVSGGKSTFLIEMAETANVLNNANPRSLVILDEVGRGTSTYDGMAIARAVIEHLHDEPRLRCRTLFATHYHELAELDRTLSGVRNLRMEVLEEGNRVVFLHRVVPGGADRSYGIYVAQLAGVPLRVVERAREILSALEAPVCGNGVVPDSSNEPPTIPFSYASVADEIKSIDIARMTPIDALAKLHDLQRALGESSS